jgi:hypothetical protein
MPALRSLVGSPSTHLIRITPVIPLALSVLVGCSGPTPTGPQVSTGSSLAAKAAAADAAGYGSGSFYPLSVGNTWTFGGEGMLRFFEDGVQTEPEWTYAFTETRSLIGITLQKGRSYFVEEQVRHEIPERDTGPFTWWSCKRQDASGLYFLATLFGAPPDLESGVAVASPAAGLERALRIDTASMSRSARADIALNRLADRLEFLRGVVQAFGRGDTTRPAEGELLELVYPVRVGASWNILPDEPWPARVERVETLDTPAGRLMAYRIEINPGGTTVHEGEWARVWYSREGFLGYSIRLSAPVTNETGEPTGAIYVADDSMMVTSISTSR